MTPSNGSNPDIYDQKLPGRNREEFRTPEAYGSPRSTNREPHVMSYWFSGFG